MKLTTLVISFLLIFNVYAGSATLSCENVIFNEVYVPGNVIDETFVENAPEKIDCDNVEIFSDVFSEINQMVNGYLYVPEIGINIMPPSNQAYFSTIVTIPVSLLLNGLAKHPILTTFAAAHEYGHALFQEALVNDAEYGPAWSVYAEYSKYLSEVQVQSLILKAEMSNVYAQLEAIGEDENLDHPLYKKMEELANALEQMEQEANELTTNNQEVENWLFDMNLGRPYNELFADTVAVLYSYRGDAIYDALFRTHTWTEGYLGYIDSVVGRDFTNRENRLDNWSVVKDEYGIFSPVRYHLWEKYLDEHLRPDKEPTFRGRLLYSLMEVLKEEMDKTLGMVLENDLVQVGPWGTVFDNMSDEMVIALNQSLIDAIDKRFSEDQVLY